MTHLGSRSSPIYFITNSQRSLPNLELGQIEFCFFREVRMAIALVTGTSSGIGLATAVSLARGGHTVIATMRNLESAGDLQKIVAAEKLPVTLAALNVDDDASVENALGKVFVDHGRLDVLVNNAGIGGGGSVEESSTARFREVMETNFFGALRVRTRSEDRSSILSCPLADLGWKLLIGYVIACSSYRAVPLFEPMAVPSSRRASRMPPAAPEIKIRRPVRSKTLLEQELT
jgi:hypothetical protein